MSEAIDFLLKSFFFCLFTIIFIAFLLFWIITVFLYILLMQFSSFSASKRAMYRPIAVNPLLLDSSVRSFTNFFPSRVSSFYLELDFSFFL